MTLDKKWLFDRPWTQQFTRIRQEFVCELIEKMQKQVGLASGLVIAVLTLMRF